MTQPSISERRRRARHGAALVEFVFVMSLILMLLFGIVEVGLLMRDQAIVAQAAREAARSAAVGSQPSVVTSRAINTATGLTLQSGNVTLEKSTNNGQAWTTLQTSGTSNDAVTGNLVRATVTYNHPLVTGLIYSGGTKQVRSQVIMRRE